MNRKQVLSQLLGFVEEDRGRGDITTESTVPKDAVVEAKIIANEEGVLAGLEEVKLLLSHFELDCASMLKDGDRIGRGDIVLSIKGNARDILTLERVILNILMRMSGIASLTHRLSKKCAKYNVTVAGTRKTTPGFRYFEKKAISVGGGNPHRFALDDAVLAKDNHIRIAGLKNAIEKAKMHGKVEVEVSKKEDAVEACRHGADTVMLDNMRLKDIKDTLAELEKRNLRKSVVIELSGKITPENIVEFARLRPDIISMGYLTTGANWLDMSMKL